MKERLVIVFIAVILGLLITTAGFFIYQSTKALPSLPQQPKNPSVQAEKTENPTPTPPNGLFLTIDTPADESLADKRTISIKGKTNPDNLIIISSNSQDIEAKPTNNGSFSTTLIIDAGVNKIISRAIDPQGEQVTDERTVTYSSEDF